MRTFQRARRRVIRTRRTMVTRPAQAEANRAALREVLGYPLQTKLKLGAPEDVQERQADANADRIMRMPAGPRTGADGEEPVRRQCVACEAEQEERVRRAPPSDEEDKRKKEEELQAKPAPATTRSGNLAADAAGRIQARRGGGTPVPAGERSFFEPRLGADLGRVRLHTDAEAAALSRNLSARAFTVGEDVFFAAGEYRPGTACGRRLLAHELTHVLQQREGGVVRRWSIGAAPAPAANWSVLTDAEHLRRVRQAEGIVRGLLGSRKCRNYFRDRCTDGGGANALRNAFDNARIYLLPRDDDVFGSSINGTHDIAVNLRRLRIGRYAIADTLTHEMFHTCDPVVDPNDEIDAENANEVCRLYTPWIGSLNPRRGGAGTRVTITGIGFGGGQGSADRVRIGGVDARIVSWAFTRAAGSSAVRIVAEVPAGAGPGGVMVINNGVASNPVTFTVT